MRSTKYSKAILITHAGFEFALSQLAKYLNPKFFIIVLVGLIIFSCGAGKDVQNTTSAEESKDREILLQNFSEVIGLYEGFVYDERQSVDPVPVLVKLFIGQEASGTNEYGESIFRPVLRALFIRKDLNDERLDYFMTARYYRESGQIILASRENAAAAIPGWGFLSIEAQLIDNVLSGKITDHRGYWGRLKVTRIGD